MAELTPKTRTRSKASPPSAELAALHARVAELEALVEARTQTIVGLGARVAELENGAPPAAAARIRELEAELAAVRATKVFRWSAAPRRWYRRLLGG